MDKIFDPVFKNKQGQLMYAVAAANPFKPFTQAVPGTDFRVFGLFVNPDGTDIHWEPISDDKFIGSGAAGFEYLYAVGSRDGRLVFISDSWNNIFTFTTDDGKEVGSFDASSVVPFGYPSGICRFAVESNTLAYATHNNYGDGVSLYPVGRGYLLRTRNSGKTWERVLGLPEEGLFGIDLDDNTIPKTLYVATDRQVWVSKDEGITWNDFSDGLPKCPHCADLRFVRHSDGTRFLYLGTWGWSVWRVKLG